MAGKYKRRAGLQVYRTAHLLPPVTTEPNAAQHNNLCHSACAPALLLHPASSVAVVAQVQQHHNASQRHPQGVMPQTNANTFTGTTATTEPAQQSTHPTQSTTHTAAAVKAAPCIPTACMQQHQCNTQGSLPAATLQCTHPPATPSCRQLRPTNTVCTAAHYTESGAQQQCSSTHKLAQYSTACVRMHCLLLLCICNSWHSSSWVSLDTGAACVHASLC
jgi:hypothetical protein